MIDFIRKSLRSFLLKESKEKSKKYDYGCVMLGFDLPKDIWGKIQDLVDDEDITTTDGLGREMDPHVTILYGIHSDVPDEDVEELIDKLTAPLIRFNHLSVFENPEFDVVKFTIRNASLEKMNKMFKELPHTSNFPKYEPHITLAYTKVGTGSQYSQTLKDDLDFKLRPNSIIYSKPDGTKKHYKFKKDEKEV